MRSRDEEWLSIWIQERPADELHVLVVVEVSPRDLMFLVRGVVPKNDLFLKIEGFHFFFNVTSRAWGSV